MYIYTLSWFTVETRNDDHDVNWAKQSLGSGHESTLKKFMQPMTTQAIS